MYRFSVHFQKDAVFQTLVRLRAYNRLGHSVLGSFAFEDISNCNCVVCVFQLLSEPQLEDISSYGYINDVYFPVITEIQLQSHVQSVSAMERVLNGVDETAI